MTTIQLKSIICFNLILFATAHYGPLFSKNLKDSKSSEQPLECSLCENVVNWICVAVTGKTTITSVNALKALSEVLKEECEKLNINIPDLSCDVIVGLIVETAIPGLFNAKLLPGVCHSPRVSLYRSSTVQVITVNALLQVKESADRDVELTTSC
uniref:Saposin B-type domain-containing protein n=1 Tax=Ditylenchus dipsaci TaxID=166011 RepID=A0A915EGP4_9BILA